VHLPDNQNGKFISFLEHGNTYAQVR